MAVRARRCNRAVAQPALVGLWLGAFLIGCGAQSPAPETTPQSTAAPAAAPAPPGPAAQQSAAPTTAAAPRDIDPRRVSFKDAVAAGMIFLEPPTDTQKLLGAGVTNAGKSIGVLYEKISAPGGLWDQAVLLTPAGKKLACTATIATDLGVIKINLLPDAAPAQVRNFVALARAGYYDGLRFDRTVRRDFADAKGTLFECLQGGCPEGTWDSAYGSIGYWIVPELSESAVHEEGTVGAWHEEVVADEEATGEEALETAACKFYITLSKAPFMDGNYTVFGKVTQGLEVARTILMKPVRQDEEYRPVQPVVIRSVTIETREE